MPNIYEGHEVWFFFDLFPFIPECDEPLAVGEVVSALNHWYYSA